MWRERKSGIIEPLLQDIYEAYNMPRQVLPEIYRQNGCIDVIRSGVITQNNSMTGKVVFGYKMEYCFDIDTQSDFNYAEIYCKLMNGKNKFVFDIDGIITNYQNNLNYELAEPNYRTIKIINTLFRSGNTIVLFTARGYKTGIDWEKVTKDQLNEWGVMYNELKFGKPDSDFYIDDKMLDLESLYQYIGRDN